MPYVSRTEQDIWGNNRVVTRREIGGEEVGYAVGSAIGFVGATAVNFLRAAKQDARYRKFYHLLNTADNALGAKNYTAAIDAINHLFRIYKGFNDSHMLYFIRGIIYLDWALYCDEWNMVNEKWSLLGGALNDFNMALQYCDNTEIVQARVVVYLEYGHLANALRDISFCMRKEPYNPEWYLGQCNVLQKLGDFDQALVAVEQAIRLEPSAIAYFKRGQTYLFRGNYDLAVADFTRSITLDSSSRVDFELRAEAYTKLGYHDAANADLAYAAWLKQSKAIGP